MEMLHVWNKTEGAYVWEEKRRGHTFGKNVANTDESTSTGGGGGGGVKNMSTVYVRSNHAVRRYYTTELQKMLSFPPSKHVGRG